MSDTRRGMNSRRFCDTMDTKGNTYRVAGLCFAVEGERLCKIIDSIDGFAPFATAGGDVLFSFAEGGEAPAMTQLRYEFEHEGVRGRFGRTEHGMPARQGGGAAVVQHLIRRRNKIGKRNNTAANEMSPLRST